MIDNPFRYSIGTRVRDKLLVGMLEPKAGDKILDNGCGLGYFTDLMAGYGADCTGIDIDGLCIEYCQRAMRGSYDVGDIKELPYPDNTFDKILCTEVLEHIEDNEKPLVEMWRVIKPGGLLVVSVPCSGGVFRDVFKKIGHDSAGSNCYEYHWHKGYSEDSLGLLLKKHGFIPAGVHYTLVFGVEVFMGLTKLAIHAIRGKQIDSQANALDSNRGLMWNLYRGLFPLVLAMARLEQPLSRILKGHMIIIKAVAEK